MAAELPGAETIALSGDPSRARDDLEALARRLTSEVAERDSATARRSAMASSSFQATCGRASTNGRKTKTGRPYAVTSVAAVTVAVRGRRSISAISPKDEPGPDRGDGLPVHLDRQLPALDHEEHETALALERDLLTGAEAALVELVGEALEISLVEIGEEPDVT